MKLRQGSIVSGLALLLAGAAAADYQGVVVVEDEFALDGVTPLADLPDYNGERVLNVFAQFDSPDDQCVGVVGTTGNPFQVSTLLGSGFVNIVLGGDLDTPQSSQFVAAFPRLNIDTFYTIGTKFSDSPLGNNLLTLPNTPGPNMDPWPPAPGIDLGWVVPPNPEGIGGNLIADITGDGNVNIDDLIELILEWGPCAAPGPCPADLDDDGEVGNADLFIVIQSWGDGTPTPQTLSGNFPDNRVLLMRLVVLPGEDVLGSGALFVRIGGTLSQEVLFQFSTVGPGACCVDDACFDNETFEACAAAGGIFQGTGTTCASTAECPGACCFGKDKCEVLTLDECDGIGGVYQGNGTLCSLQAVFQVNHNGPPDQWSHAIVGVSTCPSPIEGEPDCVDAPDHLDPWATGESGGMNCEDFSHPDACPIPADFFAPGSDPFDGQVCFVGEPIGVTNVPGIGLIDVGEADTLVRRSDDPFDRCDLPSPTEVQVDIVIEQLNLVSVDPIIVTFNGGQDPEAWDVRVLIEDSSNQPGGQLFATKTHCNGGVFDSVLAACPRFVFTRVGDGRQLELDYCGDCDPAGIVMSSAGVGWVHDVDGGLGLVSPVCSAFHPGVDDTVVKTDCDCNGNQVRDKCDIEAGTADCDLDGVPDQCVAPPCEGDTDFNNLVDVADLVNVVLDWSCSCDALPIGLCVGDVNFDGVTNVDDLVAVILAWGECR